MLNTLAVSGYRSLQELVLSLGMLNVITGPNGSGKSNIFRALRLLSDVAEGRLIQSLAREGGLDSTLWAGPETIPSGLVQRKIPLQGAARRKGPIRLQMGFSSDEFSYTIDLGTNSAKSRSAFHRDPIVKRECVWRGSEMRPRNLCVDRGGPSLRCRPERTWESVEVAMTPFASMLTEYADPKSAPELILLRDTIRAWRFYDHFRTDLEAPARRVEIGTYTPVLAADGSDLAAALQTILEIGNAEGLEESIDDAFPGSQLAIDIHDGRFEVSLSQTGMLRSLRASELSDGTLRYLLWVAALLTPRPPELMVLNEPETSLHPDLLPALGRLITRFAADNQVIVVTHAQRLVAALTESNACLHYRLEKSFGATQLLGIDPFDIPPWKWPKR